MLTVAEVREHARLLRKWARGKASAKEIERCRVLDRKAGIYK